MYHIPFTSIKLFPDKHSIGNYPFSESPTSRALCNIHIISRQLIFKHLYTNLLTKLLIWKLSPQWKLNEEKVKMYKYMNLKSVKIWKHYFLITV